MERTELTRDVEAIQIPGGHTMTLEKGWDVVITQSLGGTYTVQVTIEGCVSPMSDNQVVAITGDINDPTSIGLFPNPAHSYVTLNLEGIPNQRVVVDVYNVVGENLIHTFCEGGRMEPINVSLLPEGIYVVNISYQENSVQIRFVKS